MAYDKEMYKKLTYNHKFELKKYTNFNLVKSRVYLIIPHSKKLTSS